MVREIKRYVDFDSLKVGEDLPTLVNPALTKIQLVRYAGASGDFNPIHTDDAAAEHSGLRGVIAQGLLIMGLAGKAVGQWVPKRRLKRFSVRFMGMSFPGDVITVNARVGEKSETPDGLKIRCDIKAIDQNDEIKLTGLFEVLHP